MLYILDDRIMIQNGMFSWSEDDSTVLKELVFETFYYCYAVKMSCVFFHQSNGF